jgi:hypothetical protein
VTPAQSQWIPASTLAIKRLLFPLRAPRWQTLGWWPTVMVTAAVNGYYEAYFAVLEPKGKR